MCVRMKAEARRFAYDPLNLTVSESLDDWDASVVERAEANGMRLTLRLHRSSPIVFFGIVVYLAMALIAAASLTIGTLVLCGDEDLRPRLRARSQECCLHYRRCALLCPVRLRSALQPTY